MASDLVSPQSPSAPPPPSERRYVAFDCETTGLNPERDGIISIGAIGVCHGEILLDDTCEAVLKTDYATPAMLVHGITLNESAAGIDEAAAVRAFLEYAKDAVFVGHHVGFDCRIVAAAARRHHLEHDRLRAIDTMRLALGLETAGVLGGDPITGFELDDLCRRFDITMHDRHTASGDAFLTAQVFLRLHRLAVRAGLDPLDFAETDL
jgi:DNA polymerase-3 subunit epsilon